MCQKKQQLENHCPKLCKVGCTDETRSSERLYIRPKKMKVSQHVHALVYRSDNVIPFVVVSFCFFLVPYSNFFFLQFNSTLLRCSYVDNHPEVSPISRSYRRIAMLTKIAKYVSYNCKCIDCLFYILFFSFRRCSTDFLCSD